MGLPRLTRAYRESAEEVISLSKIKESGLGLESTLSLTYSDFDSVKYKLVKSGFEISKVSYKKDIKLTFIGKEEKAKEFLKDFPKEKIIDMKENTLYSEVEK